MHPQFTDKARKTCKNTWMQFEECCLRATRITRALFGTIGDDLCILGVLGAASCVRAFFTFWLEYEWLPRPVRTALVSFRKFMSIAQELQKHHLIMSAKLGPKTRQARPGLVLQSTEISPGDQLRPFRGGKKFRSECLQVPRKFRHMVHCMLIA